MKKEFITYYFGAGASTGAIPVVNNFKEDMDVIDNKVDFYLNKLHGTSDAMYLKYMDESSKLVSFLYRDLKDLKNILSNHISFDTYARIQYLRNNVREIKKLKYALSVYLTILQIINKTNPRYESFLASIIELNEDDVFLPETVNFISWNYDMQLEKAIAELLGYKNHNAVYQILNVLPGMKKEIKSNIPFLIKLNGTAAFHYRFDQSIDLIEYLFTKNDKDGLKEIIDYYNKITLNPNMNAPFSFSWETEDKMVEASRKKAAEIISATEILVTIGYSFPVFNRKIDRELLSLGNRIKKIYVQNDTKDIDSVLVRLSSLLDRTVEIIAVRDVEQFYIPFELV